MIDDIKSSDSTNLDLDIEIRTIYEPSANLEEGPKEKKYMVHKVDAMTDTLF
jgi:hypothetical protein